MEPSPIAHQDNLLNEISFLDFPHIKKLERRGKKNRISRLRIGKEFQVVCFQLYKVRGKERKNNFKTLGSESIQLAFILQSS